MLRLGRGLRVHDLSLPRRPEPSLRARRAIRHAVSRRRSAASRRPRSPSSAHRRRPAGRPSRPRSGRRRSSRWLAVCRHRISATSAIGAEIRAQRPTTLLLRATAPSVPSIGDTTSPTRIQARVSVLNRSRLSGSPVRAADPQRPGRESAEQGDDAAEGRVRLAGHQPAAEHGDQGPHGHRVGGDVEGDHERARVGPDRGVRDTRHQAQSGAHQEREQPSHEEEGRTADRAPGGNGRIGHGLSSGLFPTPPGFTGSAGPRCRPGRRTTAEEAGVDEQGVQLVQRHPVLPAVGERGLVLVGLERALEAGGARTAPASPGPSRGDRRAPRGRSGAPRPRGPRSRCRTTGRRAAGRESPPGRRAR